MKGLQCRGLWRARLHLLVLRLPGGGQVGPEGVAHVLGAGRALFSGSCREMIRHGLRRTKGRRNEGRTRSAVLRAADLPVTPAGLQDANNLAGLRRVGAREGRLTGGCAICLTQVATCTCTICAHVRAQVSNYPSMRRSIHPSLHRDIYANAFMYTYRVQYGIQKDRTT